jgi:hypothetical protein
LANDPSNAASLKKWWQWNPASVSLTTMIPSLSKQQHYMIRNFVAAFFALTVLVSCVSRAGNESYQPATKPEKIEFARDRLDVYPNDVRKDPAFHAGAAVAWAGIIRSTDAREEGEGGKIVADTVFEHHYFDWVQNNDGRGVKLFVSPRGEGLFCAKWHMDKIGKDATAESAEKYAGQGKLALVYGVPEKVDADGTVVLRYRYLRILGADCFSTNKFDYGRFGEPFRAIHSESKTNSPPR